VVLLLCCFPNNSISQSRLSDPYKVKRDSLSKIALSDDYLQNYIGKYNCYNCTANFRFTISGVDQYGMHQSIRFGVHPEATFCIDDALGEMEMFPPFPWVTEIRFSDPREPVEDCYGMGTWLDLRPFDNQSQLDSFKIKLLVTIEGGGYPLILSWSSGLDQYCDSMKMKYNGSIGGSVLIDMFSTNSHAVVDSTVKNVMIYKWGAKDSTYMPSAPSNLTIKNKYTHSVDLEWTDNSIIGSGFYIYKSTDAVKFYKVDSTVKNILTYTGTHTRNLLPNTMYFWRVTAYCGEKESDFTDTYARTLYNSISGKVFVDDNCNGILDLSENGIQNRNIIIHGPADTTVKTDLNGNYLLSYLPDGEYTIALESEPGCIQTSPQNPENYLMVLSGGQQIINKDFGNFKLVQISGISWRDYNRNGVKDLSEPAVDGVTINLDGTVSANNKSTVTTGGGLYQFAAVLDNYTLSAVPLSGMYQTSPAGSVSYTVNVNASGLVISSRNFGFNTVADSVKYTSFCYDSIAALMNGKIQKAVKKKPIGAYWEFKIPNSRTNPISEVHVEFKNDVKLISSHQPFAVYGGEKKKFYFTGGALAVGETLVIKGYSTKGKVQSIKKYYLGPTSGTAHPGVEPYYQYLELPLPNFANIVDEIFTEAGYTSAGLVIGNVLANPDDGGWVRITKSSNAMKSIRDAAGPHSGNARFFDTYGTKLFTKEQQSVPPKKHNNKLFAEVLTLKLNIISSELVKTPGGFGDLIYYNPGNSLHDSSIIGIERQADRHLTLRAGSSSNFYNVIRNINNAFAGVIDTGSFSSRIELKGNKYLADVPYLRASEDGKTTQMNPFVETHEYIPSNFELAQNYPNPFNPSTTIEFSIPEDAFVTIKVYNVMGQEVTTITDREFFAEGMSAVNFEAGALASGLYFYSINVESTEEDAIALKQVKKMLLLK
jgi:hypothetical protein